MASRSTTDPTTAEIVRLRKLHDAAKAKAQDALAGMAPEQAERRRADDLARSETLARLNSLNPAGAWHFLIDALDTLQRRVTVLETASALRG